MTRRYAKILMVLSLSAFAFMVTFNNISDYGSNFSFVQHVGYMPSVVEVCVLNGASEQKPGPRSCTI
jgi:predicted small integral membrane protein